MNKDAKSHGHTCDNTEMDVSVIVVSWNASRCLRECLQSLTEGPFQHTLEVIVVDNASTDGSAEMVAADFPQVRLIRNDRNLGFAKANNVGIGQSTGRYVCLINSDVHVLPNCLDRLVEYLDAHSLVGLAGPKILNADRSLQSSCRRFPSLWNNFCESVGLFRMFPRTSFFSTEHMLCFPHDRIVDADVLVGCFWMIRREALESVGLLDEDFFIYAEDLDWCRRCWNAGWRVSFFPEAQAIHYRAASSANDPARFAIEQQRAVLHYWDKYHSWAGRFGIRGILFSRYFVRYLLSVISHRVRVVSADNEKRLLLSRACMEALLSSDSVRKV